MKKFIAMLSLLVFLSTNTAGAIIDIPDDYWANIEVNDMVDSNIIPLDGGGYFNPNDSVFMLYPRLSFSLLPAALQHL